MSRTLTFPQAVNEGIRQEMRRDPAVLLMGEDVGRYGGMFRVTEGIFEEFGEMRVWDTPISESGFVGMALGLAMTGKRPIVELMFFDFMLVAMDQILNQVAKARYMSGGKASNSLVIRTQGGGFKGAASQHSQMLETLILHVPGFKVVAPSNAADAKGLLAAAVRDDNPVFFIEHKQLYGASGVVPEGEHFVPIGKAAVAREGTDATICSYSYEVTMALEAAELLAKEGISVEVIDLRTLNPLDWETISTSVRKTHRMLVVHESHYRCGFGSDLAAQVQEKLFDDLDAPVLRVCAEDVPVPFAQALETACLPSPAKIVDAVRKLVA